MAFTITFGSQTINGVKSVTSSVTTPPERIADTSSNGRQLQKREFTVKGLIKVLDHSTMTRSIPTALSTLRSLEDNLRNEGLATLTVPGYGTMSNTRLASVKTDEYANNPIIAYTLVFLSDTLNASVASVTLGDGSTTHSFTPYPEVSDSLDRQDPTITFASQTTTKNRSFGLKGYLTGTAAQILSKKTELEGICAGATDTLTLTTNRGAFSVKCFKLSFKDPLQTDVDTSVEYDIALVQEQNYSLENNNLSHTPLTFGDIQFSIVSSYSHNIDYENRNGTYIIVKETLSVSGLIEFSTFAAAESYQSNFKSQVSTPRTITSTTGNTLVVTSASYSDPKREGRTTAGAQKFILSGNFNAQTIKSENDLNVSNNETYFGIAFALVGNKSYTGNLNVRGIKTQDSLSVSGVCSNIPVVSVGNFDGTYYLTNLSIDGRDDQGRYRVSASGRTLDTFETLESFLSDTFQGLIFFDEITSHQRSASFRYEQTEYKQTSYTESISGNIFLLSSSQDARSTVLPLIETASQKIQSLSTFRITNVSVGGREKFVKAATGESLFKQSVSISGTRNFVPDASSGGSGPTIVEESNYEIKYITNEYTQITIPGGPLIFKKTGIQPGEIVKTNTRRRQGGSISDTIDAPPVPDSSGVPSNSVDLGVKRSGSASSKTVTRKWIVLEGSIPDSIPTTYST